MKLRGGRWLLLTTNILLWNLGSYPGVLNIDSTYAISYTLLGHTGRGNVRV